MTTTELEMLSKEDVLRMLSEEKDFKKISACVFSYYEKNRDPDVKEAIVKSNEGLVHYVSRKYAEHLLYEDILQEGRIGLLYAVDKYRLESGCNFSTYAVPYIWGYIKKFVNSTNGLYMPINLVYEINSFNKVKEQNPGKSPEEYSALTGLSLEKIAELEEYETFKTLAYIDACAFDDSKETVLDRTGGEFPNLSENIEKREIRDAFNKLLEETVCDKRQLRIVKEVFGFNSTDAKTYTQVAKELGISRDEVKRTVCCTMKRLRVPKRKARLLRLLGVPSGMRIRDVCEYISS